MQLLRNFRADPRLVICLAGVFGNTTKCGMSHNVGSFIAFSQDFTQMNFYDIRELLVQDSRCIFLGD